MKKILGYLMIFILSATMADSAVAQDCEAYFPMEEGAFIETYNYDKKDKLTSITRYTVLEKEVYGENNVKVKVQLKAYDKKDEETMEGQLEMLCEDGVYYVDMKDYINPESMGIEDMEDMEITVDANNMEMPANPEVGQTLNDGYIKMSFGASGVSVMNITVNITNRTVEAIEDITTPAGTFNCVKISQDIETKTFMKNTAKSVEWYAKNIGAVRSETFNNKGKPTGYSVLNDIQLP